MWVVVGGERLDTDDHRCGAALGGRGSHGVPTSLAKTRSWNCRGSRWSAVGVGGCGGTQRRHVVGERDASLGGAGLDVAEVEAGAVGLMRVMARVGSVASRSRLSR